jgi:hypothetical protein
MWIQNVTMFGDREAGSNMPYKHWVWKVTILLEAATAFYVQLFFCRRLWVRVSRPVAISATLIRCTGNISERICCRHLHHFVSARACYRRRCGMLPPALLY